MPATGVAASNVDIYQVNATFLDALGGDERAYLAARALQFFLPGVPQVYYVGALGGRNDMDLLARTGVGRDINRHHFTSDEIDDALATPFVHSLGCLARLRNRLAAFEGDCEVHAVGAGIRVVRWSGDSRAILDVDLSSGAASIAWTDPGGDGEIRDLLSGPLSVVG